MALIDLARRQTRADLEQLAEDIRDGSVTDGQEDDLRELVKDAGDEQQNAAIDENPAIADLIAALDLPAPREFGRDNGPAQAGTDEPVIIEEPADEEPTELQRESTEEEVAAAFGDVNRPTAPFSDTEKALLRQRIPQPNIRTQYERLENIRSTTEDGDISPSVFWDRFADQLLDRKIISREEFVAGRQDPESTAIGS